MAAPASLFASRRARRSTRPLTVVVAALAMVVGTLVAIPTAQAAPAPPKPRAARDLPALASPPAPKVVPEIPPGDFANPPPHPDDLEAAVADKAERAPSFDPERSQLVEAETTPTRTVHRNSDSSYTASISAEPVRFRDGAGWHDLDMRPVPGSDGTLTAAAAPGSARLAASAEGQATLDTPAGLIAVSYPDAAAVAAITTDTAVTYAGALAGRDLSLALGPEGFKETVTLTSPDAGGSYVVEFVLPAGLVARQGEASIDFVDRSGVVVAAYAKGWAYDASFPGAGPEATTPVALRLVETKDDAATDATVATVEASVEGAWLHDPARKFPVSIDPTVYRYTSATGAADTWVYSHEYADTNYLTHPWLVVGTPDGIRTTRSYLRFDLAGLPTGDAVWVTSADLLLYNWFTHSCASRQINLYRLAGAFGSTTTWNNRPSPAATNPSEAPVLAGAGATGCNPDFKHLGATALAQDWLRNGFTNHGMELRAANEADTWNYRGFYAAEFGSSTIPRLEITYDRLPPVPAPVAPAEGEVVSTVTPTLAVNTVTDPDGDPVSYWFRGTPAPDAETGSQAVDSGWITTTPTGVPCAGGQICYQPPPGALADGVTYHWHAHVVRHEAP